MTRPPYMDKGCQSQDRSKSLLRYIVVAVLLFILGLFDFGNLIMAFVGMLGLKISAYLQPLFMKVTDRFPGEVMHLPPAKWRQSSETAGKLNKEEVIM